MTTTDASDILKNFSEEYETNSKRMALINQYYSKKYNAQKNILINIAIALVIIIVFTGIGKVSGLESYTNYIVIIVGVLISVKTIFDLWDHFFRSNQNYDEYKFRGNLPTPAVESFNGSKSSEGFESAPQSVYCTELGTEYTENADLKILNGSYQRCFTATDPNKDHITEYKNCYDDDYCKSYIDDIWSNDYKYNNPKWFKNIKNIFSSGIVSNNARWNSGGELDTFCDSVCSADDSKSLTDCSVLCKGGSNGDFDNLFTDTSDTITCTGVNSIYATNFYNKTTDDVLNKQSWLNTDTYGADTWKTANDDNSEYPAASLFASLTNSGWTKNRNKNEALEHCKLICGYDMYDCLNGNVDGTNMQMSVNNIKDKCSKKCSLKIPNHIELPPLISDKGVDTHTPPMFDDADTKWPLAEVVPSTGFTTWDEYRKNY